MSDVSYQNHLYGLCFFNLHNYKSCLLGRMADFVFCYLSCANWVATMTPDYINELQTRGLWPMDKEKPREWWLLDVVDHLGLKTLTAFRYTGETYGIHVIEYRAYDELKTENERLNEMLAHHGVDLMNERDQWREQAEALAQVVLSGCYIGGFNCDQQIGFQEQCEKALKAFEEFKKSGK